MHQLTEQEANALAYILNRIRPDWTTKSILTILSKNRETPSLADLTIAATTKAQDPTCKTPAPIFLPGNHWPERARHRIDPGPECPDHTGHHAYNCGPCTTDITLGDRPPHLHGKALTPHKRNPPPHDYRALRNSIKTMADNPTPTGSNQETRPSDM